MKKKIKNFLSSDCNTDMMMKIITNNKLLEDACKELGYDPNNLSYEDVNKMRLVVQKTELAHYLKKMKVDDVVKFKSPLKMTVEQFERFKNFVYDVNLVIKHGLDLKDILLNKSYARKIVLEALGDKNDKVN